MAPLDPSTVVVRDGLSPTDCYPYDSWPHSLSTDFETTWTLDWGWRERGRWQNLSRIIPYHVPGAEPGRQGLKIIQERGEEWRGQGRTKKERDDRTWKKDEGVADKVEKEKPRKNLKKRAKRAFLDFSEVFPFPLYWPPLRPFFRFGRPSLPWFFLSLFILRLFLVWSSALAIQALPLAHDMEWFLKGSTISPSRHPQSSVQVVSKCVLREWRQEP